MNEMEFLNAVLQGAGRGSFAEGYSSDAAWEIHAQVVISAFLKTGYGITKCRELKYEGSNEHCDFGFELGGETYAVELKVEASDGKVAGKSLDYAITADVNKLHGFKADHNWFLVIVRSAAAKEKMELIALRGDSWVTDEEAGFLAALCNINTQPHGLPWKRLHDEGLRADRNNMGRGKSTIV